jgi:hypothetical protein
MGTAPKALPFAVAILVTLAASPALLSPGEYRSREVIMTREMQREHSCPSTGKTSGACPGYRKDHIKPLRAVVPMQCKTFKGRLSPPRKLKIRWERIACAR